METVLFDYIKCIVFLFFSVAYFNFIGSSVCGEKSLFSKKIIIGYVIHSAIIGVFGIVTQLFCLPWLFFAICNAITIIGLSIYSIKQHQKENKIDTKSFFIRIGNNIIHNFGIYFFTTLLLLLSILYIRMHLYGNHLDDGLYLMRIAQLPYTENPFMSTITTGFVSEGKNSLSSIAYTFNVFDLEASVYTFLLNVPASLFARFVLNWQNYFLFVNCLYWLASLVFQELKLNKKVISLALGIVVFFAFYDIWMRDYLYIVNDFLFNSGMWYGSSIVRCCGLFFLLLPLLDKKSSWKHYWLYYLLSSLTLLSKSSIALPIIVLLFFVYLSYYAWENNKKIFLIVISLFIIVIGIGIYRIGLPNSTWELIEHGQDSTRLEISFIQIYSTLQINIKKILFIIILFFFSLLMVWKKSNLKKWVVLNVSVLSMMFIPVINYVFIQFSIYNFVALRMVTSITYVMIVTAYYSFLYYLILLMKNERIYTFTCIFVTFSLLITFLINYKNNLSFTNTLVYLKNNPYLIPQSTLELGERLERISKENTTSLYVVSEELVPLYDEAYTLAINLRINASDIFAVSAIPRYNAGSNAEFSDYSKKEQEIVNMFLCYPEDYFKEFQLILETYPSINCAIVRNENVIPYLNEMGFICCDKYEDKKITYFICIKIN